MSIKHFYSQTVADGTATSVVRPSDWNSNHQMVYNLSGNTLGSSQITGADITLVGGSNITLSADTANSKLNIIGNTAQDFWSIQGNTAGTNSYAWTNDGLYLYAGNNVTLSGNGSTLSIAAAGGGGGGVTLSNFPEFPLAVSSSSIVSGTSGAGSTTAAMYINPMMLDSPLAYQEVEFLMSHGALSAGTGSCTVGWHLGIYTLNGGTALSLVTSYSAAAYISQNSATAQTVFSYWGSNSTVTNATTQTSGNISAAYMTAGLRDVKLADNLTDTLAAGTYYLAHCVTMRSSSVNIGASLMTGMYAPGITNHAYLGQSALSGGIGRLIGSATSQITGVAGNTNSMSMPSSINTTAITMSASNAGRWFQPRLYV